MSPRNFLKDDFRETPGPGAYTPVNPTHVTPKFSLKGRPKDRKDSDHTPGPQDYNPEKQRNTKGTTLYGKLKCVLPVYPPLCTHVSLTSSPPSPQIDVSFAPCPFLCRWACQSDGGVFTHPFMSNLLMTPDFSDTFPTARRPTQVQEPTMSAGSVFQTRRRCRPSVCADASSTILLRSLLLGLVHTRLMEPTERASRWCPGAT